MKLISTLLTCFLFLNIVTAYSQNSRAEANVILYDPLFWKKDLKLNSTQCQKIREINSEFFQQINALANDKDNQSTVTLKTARFLNDRSERIWETFQPRQKKKWKKLWEEEAS